MSIPQLIVIRHGATDLSQSGAFVGRSDPDLNFLGRSQAASWRWLAGSDQVDRCYHSPLRRTAETAALAGFEASLPSNLLVEWDLGTLEGLNAESVREASPKWSLFVDGPPDGSGERPATVEERARLAVQSLRLRDTPRSSVVLIGHGQFLKVLAAVLLELPVDRAAKFSLGPARAGFFTLRSNGHFSLTGWNVAAGEKAEDVFGGLT